jgi:AbrB family looped-hinge helix DNA binding protein
MDMTRISNKGQVLIPKTIRDQLAVKAGDTFHVEVEGDAIVLRVLKKERRLPTNEELDRVAGSLDYGGPYPTEEDVETAMAEMFRSKWSR